MSNQNASLNALVAQLMDLSDDEQLALVDNPGSLKKHAATLVHTSPVKGDDRLPVYGVWRDGERRGCRTGRTSVL